MTSITGLSLLLVEDEFLIAIDAQDMLEEMGAASVDIAGTFEEAERLIGEKRFDLAVLDVNLNGRMSFPLAEKLLAAGTPVLFGTGYSLMSRPMPGFERGVCVSKPYTAQTLKQGLLSALAAKNAAASQVAAAS
jgi:DNA-binding response OmpR family regulator